LKIGRIPLQPAMPKIIKEVRNAHTVEETVVQQSPTDPKKALKETMQKIIAEMEEARTDMGEDNPKAQSLIEKFKSGKKLTPKEMAYLRKHAPGIVDYIQRISQQREIIELGMKAAPTKSDVQLVAFHAAKLIERYPKPEEREILARHLADAKNKYEQTEEYKEKLSNPLDKQEKRWKTRHKRNQHQSGMAKTAYEQNKILTGKSYNTNLLFNHKL